jgi:hypothetical protein
MENPQKIEFKSLDDLCVICKKNWKSSFRNIVLECMPDCKRKMASNVPFTTVILRFVIFGQPQFLGNNLKGVAIGFAKVIHFDETLQRQN